MAILPDLVELKLVKCRVSSKADVLQLLGASGLTSLHLNNVSWTELLSAASKRRGGYTEPHSVILSVLSALEQCSNLVALHLDLPERCSKKDLETAGPSPLTSISQLQHLRSLEVTFPYEVPSDFMPNAPPATTHLKLEVSTYDEKTPMVVQHIPHLQHLQSLHIKSISRFDNADLVNMTQLLCLRLENVALDAAALGRMPHLQQLMLEGCNTEATASSVLTAIGKLTQLRVLAVAQQEATKDSYHSLLHDAPLSAMSALTASSQLQRLHVDCLVGGNGSTLPGGAVAHMFQPDRLLQQLLHLQLGPLDVRQKARHDDFYPSGCSGVVSGEDLQCIALCCPRLHSLHVNVSLKAREAVDPLLQLRECRSLSLGGTVDEFDNDAAAVVAQMTQLTHLSCLCNRGFNSMGLQLLTRLTGLKKLEITPMVEHYDNDYSVMEMDLCAMFGMENSYPPVVLTSKVGGCTCFTACI
jgi:hypothetical protein